MKVICILGNQLFEPKRLPHRPGKDVLVFMREDKDLCTHFRYHKHKIIFILSAMRKYAGELRKAGYQVHYEKLGDFDGNFEHRLFLFMELNKSSSLLTFDIEDKFFEQRTLAVLFFENGTKIANLVSHNHKGMTSEPSQKTEKKFFT